MKWFKVSSPFSSASSTVLIIYGRIAATSEMTPFGGVVGTPWSEYREGHEKRGYTITELHDPDTETKALV